MGPGGFCGFYGARVPLAAKSPSCPLTDPRQFGILQGGPWLPGSDAVLGRSRKGIHLFATRRLAAAALLPIAGAFFVLLFSATDSRAQNPSGNCEEGAAEITVLSAPMAPWKGAPLRVVFAAEKPLDGELSLIGPDGRVVAKSRDRQGGPPYFWFAEVASPAVGTWRAALAASGCGTITRDIAVRDAPAPPPAATPGAVWPVRASWNRATENLYSAWIQKLFDAPLDAEPSWPTLRDVLRDRSRNILFNYLGAGEDEVSAPISPDCADLVYFLRAYFAFKMGLPFGYSNCSRGGGGSAPKCYALADQSQSPRGGAAAGTGGAASAPICRSSPTPCSPAPCACWRPTTTPIFTPCR